jgi:hypothetical protein
MTPAPTLQELIDGVHADSSDDEALLQLSEASKTVGDLERLADALLDHFVEQCRRSGHSWSEISGALGVSKQAAHKRFTADAPSFERFTERARTVLSQSEREAHRLGHGFVGTEHILLALVAVVDGLAARVLAEAGISKSIVEENVLVLIKRGTATEEGTLPLTPKAKAVLRHAVDEALRLGHNYIGTEHLLLGLVGDEQSVAGKVLLELRASYGFIKDRTLALLAGLSEA